MLVTLLFLFVIPASIIILTHFNEKKRAGKTHPPTGDVYKKVEHEDTLTKSKNKKDVTVISTTTSQTDKKETKLIEHKVEEDKDKDQKEEEEETVLPNGPKATVKAPKILIAYATNSQNAFQLSHKLFNLLQQEIHVKYSSCNDNSNKCGCCDTVAIPQVKILELREEPPRRTACSTETLLEDNSYNIIIFIVSTFTDGAAPSRSQTFELLLKDAYEDHRFSRDTLSHKQFALFGLGDVMYGEQRFNTFAKHLHEYCRGLGAPNFAVPPVYASEEKAQTLFKIFTTALLKWFSKVEFVPLENSSAVKDAEDQDDEEAAIEEGKESSVEAKKAYFAVKIAKKTAKGKTAKSAAESTVGTSETKAGDEGEDEEEEDAPSEEEEEDMEDLLQNAGDDNEGGEKKELLYPKLQKNLEKQGYQIIGSHSAVKLCRWTKSMLRGRGGCYKYTFYNIKSFQCMELTPSLACANKCVFCWRHHTNPVSTYFRWKQDDAATILAGGLERQVHMIKQLRSVPGVTDERLEEAKTVKHCALSLVGEPIMYPQINSFCHMLHERKISSFMVTNAQFPAQLRNLIPVVQLYLSIDAPTSEEIKKIDRPLFEDYWERVIACVEELKRKRQRTVFRLTLINEENDQNIENYTDLVMKGWPDFIEVKGVTYCGTSNSNTINMKTHVPRHDQVIQFCKDLCASISRRFPSYKTPQMEGVEEADEHEDNNIIYIPPQERNRPYHIACEHEHSCCVLIALDKFYFNGCWNTWINYEKFYALAAQHSEPAVLTTHAEETEGNNNNDKPHVHPSDINYDSNLEDYQKYAHYNNNFSALDYADPTPRWATYKSKERGFDPKQTRMLGKKARPVSITSGC